MTEVKGKLKKGTARATSTSGKISPTQSVRPTTSYSIFQNSVKRAENLIDIHRMAHGAQSRPPTFLADAHRAAVVLAVSALDAFVRTFVIEQLVQILEPIGELSVPEAHLQAAGVRVDVRDPPGVPVEHVAFVVIAHLQHLVPLAIGEHR